LPKDSVANSQAFLNQQQQQLSSLIAAANVNIAGMSQLNGLVLPADLDKKVSIFGNKIILLLFIRFSLDQIRVNHQLNVYSSILKTFYAYSKDGKI